MRIGLVPISAKPYHAGHDGLVRIAAQENDSVALFVSTSDRARRGEIKISGSVMEEIWRRYIEPTLPSNVTLIYGGVPVSEVYKTLENAEMEGSPDTFVIYSDDVDILKYADEKLRKSAPTLFSNGQIERRGISRSETVQVSGTQMREFLKNGDVQSFVALLPRELRKNGKTIYDLLLTNIAEALLRDYTRKILIETL